MNKRDAEGNNVFEGGFLGLDNISVVRPERADAARACTLEQADATAWMAMYCLDLMRIALELADRRTAPTRTSPASSSSTSCASPARSTTPRQDDGRVVRGRGLLLRYPEAARSCRHVRVRSMVGLIPLFAVHVHHAETYGTLDNFRRRTEWFLEHRTRTSPRLVTDAARRPPRALGGPLRRRWSGCSGTSSTRTKFLSPLRPALAVRRPRAAVRAPARRRRVPRRLRARRVAVRAVRGELELARPRVAAAQRARARSPPALPALRGRRLHRGAATGSGHRRDCAMPRTRSPDG